MHYSPQVALLETVLGCLLFLFFLHHAWCYDRLDSLRLWRYAGSRDVFKKVMTMCYLLALPSLGVSAAIVAWIKYQMGWMSASSGGMPVFYLLWPQHLQEYLEPIAIVQTLVWFFDLVVHHQELTFWFWLVRATPSSPPWFQSFWFKFFLAGCVAYAALFVVLLKMYIGDLLVLERNVDIAYSSVTIAESIAFANIFWVFPSFIRNAKAQGGTNEVLGRLLSFHELNKIRIAARLCFGICLFALGMDGFTAEHKLNTNPAILDTLLFVSVITNVLSALLTLMVFMPRAILREHGLEATRTAPPATPSAAVPPSTADGSQYPMGGERTTEAEGIEFNISPPPVPTSPVPEGPQIIGRPSQAIPRRPNRPHRANQSEDFDVREPFDFAGAPEDAGEPYYRGRTASDATSMGKEMLEMREAPFATLDANGHQVKIPTLNRLRAQELERRGLRLNPSVAYYRSPIDLGVPAQHYRAPSHPSNMA